MPHDTALLATIAAGLSLAFLFGLVAVRLRMPPLVGYLLAGIIVGPHTPGIVVDTGIAQQLSEIGVILLMFGVGIHFSVGDLLAVRRIALPGAVGQIVVATLLGAVVSHLLGWPWGAGIVFGLCLSVASTVVLLRALEDRGILDTADGRIAVGWLVVEDLVTVIVLVLLPALAPSLGGAAPMPGGAGPSVGVALALTLGKVIVFVALMLVVGIRAVPWLLARVARTGSRELFTLAVLAVALGIAFGASVLFDVSFALGAFFAGMVVNASDLSQEAAQDALPLQDAFSVLFFVAVGMLFDPTILVQQPLELLAVVFIVMIGKSAAAYTIVKLFGRSTHTAFLISASLAQIGEFSFILAALARALGLLPAQGESLIVAGALISITLNPAAFAAAGRAYRHSNGNDTTSPHDEPEEAVAPDAGLRGHVIVIGAGRVGRPIAAALARHEVPFVVIEQRLELVAALRSEGVPVIFGDATRPEVLRRAHLEHARLLVIATPDPYHTRAVLDLAQRINPDLGTIVRTHSEAERAYLEGRGVDWALVGERELAIGMMRRTLEGSGVDYDMAAEAARVLGDVSAAQPPAAH